MESIVITMRYAWNSIFAQIQGQGITKRGSYWLEKDMQKVQTSKLYNKYLLEYTSCTIAYDDFCEAKAHAGWETATTIVCKCEGWNKASEAILNPAIEGKNQLHHRLQDKEMLSQADITQLQQQVKDVNKWNQDLVELAKTQW